MYATESMPDTAKKMGGLEGSGAGMASGLPSKQAGGMAGGMPSKQAGGLEGSSTGGSGTSATEKLAEAGKNIKGTVGEKMDKMKDAMHLNK